MDSGRAPIFVIGTGRSGTTLLRLMLSAHPRIYITHEASFYVWESLYPRRAPRRRMLDYYFQTFSFRWLRLDPARVLAGLPDPLPRERVADAFLAVMREKAAQYGRVRFGDKTPSHAWHLKRLFRDFPDARVIHIVRDPRGVALSLSRMPWASGSLNGNARACEDELRKVRPFRDRVIQVRLEDLLADPRETMGRILEYVGEPWDDAVLDHAHHLPDVDDMPPLPWLTSATRPRGKPGADWTSLSPVDIRRIERTARGVMQELGYAPAELDHEPSRLAVWWSGVRQIPASWRFLAAYLRLGLWMRDVRHLDLPRTNELLRRVNTPAWAHYPGFEMPPAPPLLLSGAPGCGAPRRRPAPTAGGACCAP